MAVSFSSSQIDRFKREAKKLVRELSMPHSDALDRIATQQGFKNWSLLVKHSDAATTIKAAPPMPRKSAPSNHDRYYLHGDQDDDNPTLFYCARCDVFTEAGHFDDPQRHRGETHGERYLGSLDRWNQRSPDSKANWRRPADAVNFLAGIAMTEHFARETMRAPFHRWLLTQTDRNDPVGDLAMDARRDKTFPTGASSRRELERYLSRHGDHVVQELRQAWREFSASQPVA